MQTEKPTVDELRDAYQFYPDKGQIRRIKGRGKGKAGEFATEYIAADQHVVVCHSAMLYRMSDVVWAMSTGEWPTNEVGHINKNRKDNRFYNLYLIKGTQPTEPVPRAGARLTGRRKSQPKSQPRPQAKSQPKSQAKSTNGRRWFAGFESTNGSRVVLGEFDNSDDADKALENATPVVWREGW